MRLENESCVPCRGGIPPLSPAEAEGLIGEIPGWSLEDGATKIVRKFRFDDFAKALEFVRRVGEVAESQQHHPDISFGWGYCTVAFRTHRIHGLHENDFIMAAKVNALEIS